MHKPLSLRAQAVSWLAQREYSERELRLRLLRRLQDQARRAQAKAGRSPAVGADEIPGTSPPGEGPSLNQRYASTQSPSTDAANQVDEVVEWLLERGYLDDQRFVASRVNVRSTRLGVARIEQELARHGLDLPPQVLQALRSSELERARAVWQRRFRLPPVNPHEAARQARFLNGRGFSAEVIRRVVPRCSAAAAVCDDAD